MKNDVELRVPFVLFALFVDKMLVLSLCKFHAIAMASVAGCLDSKSDRLKCTLTSMRGGVCLRNAQQSVHSF
ncbi:MAG: hypothetical protein H7252_05025 [Cytophaga sp.]|nr:hypothetical protein [Undibacterium sp.]